MANQNLIKNIIDRLEMNDITLSDREVYDLIRTTVKTIDAGLDKYGEVEVEDFGSFQRRTTTTSSYTNFKPSTRVVERIKRRK